MKKYKQYITPLLFILILAAWAGRSHIRNFFPPAMKFADATLHSMDDKRSITINDYKGNVVIVSCFQTWCIDCVKETPVLDQLAAAIHSPAFKIIYVTDEEVDRVKAFRNRFPSDNISFAFSTASMKALGISVFPTTFLLNKKGEVIQTKMEGYDWMSEKEKILELINE